MLSVSNVGLSAYKQYPIETFSNTIMNNEVNFTNKKGALNCMWNAGNCGEVTGWKTNIYNADLTASILPIKIIGRCKEASVSEENKTKQIKTKHKTKLKN